MPKHTPYSALLHRLPHRLVRVLRDIGQLGDEQGYQIYVVGGVVRDLLLRQATLDLDLAVEGDGIALARVVSTRYRTGLVVFERFSTARLVFRDGLKMDIATTRQESYAQPAVLPTVQPASIQEDLHRRDFTINAIAIQLNPGQFGRVFDPYGGQRDLRTRTVRVLHACSFQDDPTRVFRAIRFEQRLGFRLERTTLRLLAQAAATSLIRHLSGPRLQNEILLLCGEHDPVSGIARLVQLKLLRFLHRRLCYPANVKRVVTVVPKALVWWARRLKDSGVDRPLVFFMALVSGCSPVVIAATIRRLALSGEQARKVSAVSRLDRVRERLTKERTIGGSKVFHLLENFSNEALVLLVATELGSPHKVQPSRLKRHVAAYVKHRSIKTILGGRDLQALGLKPGPQFKTILGELLDARLDGIISTEAEERAFIQKKLGTR